MALADESAVLRACRSGSLAAWESLIECHYAATGRFIAQLGFDLTSEDVEDLCQETFVSAVHQIHSFHGSCRFQTWLFRIAVNKTKDFRQRQTAAKRGGGLTPLPLHLESSEGKPIDPPSSGPAPDRNLIHSEDAEIIGRALDSLAPPCREIIQLRYFADLSYDEIAGALELNPKTVSSRLSKCLGRLRRAVESVQRERSSAFSV